MLYESRTGNTRRAAELIGGAAEARGHSVAVYPVRDFDFKELALADAVFIGTWCDGLVLFGHRPGSAGQIDRHLPVLDRKQVGVFLTYAIRPGKGLRKLARLVEAKGADGGCRPHLPPRPPRRRRRHRQPGRRRGLRAVGALAVDDARPLLGLDPGDVVGRAFLHRHGRAVMAR